MLQSGGELDSLRYLATLDDRLPEAPNLDAYIDIVIENWALRGIIEHNRDSAKRAIGEDRAEESIAADVEWWRKLQVESNHHEEPRPTVPQWPEPIHEDGY